MSISQGSAVPVAPRVLPKRPPPPLCPASHQPIHNVCLSPCPRCGIRLWL